MVKLPIVTVSESSFPQQERAWLDAVVDRPLPTEPQASCDDCAMCKPHSAPLTSIDVLFDNRSTCCTIIPHITNYRVGQMLQAGLDGEPRLRARIASRRGVSPLGVGQTREEAAADAKMRKNRAFGQDITNRCPYYDEARSGCTLWQLRPSLCSTWHCRYERGRTSQKVWLALRDLLNMAERALNRWCLERVGLDDSAFSVLFPLEVKSLPATSFPQTDLADDELYRRGWANWLGREEEFFAACAELVSDLDWEQVRTIAGVEAIHAERLLQQALAAVHDDSLPQRLSGVPPVQAVSSSHGNVRVRSYSSYDIRDWPQRLLLALGQIEDASPEAIRNALRDEHGLEVDDDMLRKLLDFGLLAATG